LHKRVQDVPSRYPVAHDKHYEAEVHYLHGGKHSVHALTVEF